LSEEELTARLAAMKLKNARLTEAHARSQADQELFEQREAVALQRRKEERLNRQQMMGEREKNRQRKLQAVGVREWDMEKNEEDFKEEGRRAKRGAHGGIGGSRYATATTTAPAAAATQTWESGDGFEVRGAGERGGRGRGRGRGGRGRGDHAGSARGGGGGGGGGGGNKNQSVQSPPTAADFPDLPLAAATPSRGEDVKPPATLEFPIKPKPGSTEDNAAAQEATALKEKPKLNHLSSFGFSSPAGEKKSWADQVEGLNSPT
jgi:hypothetical protein